MNMKAMLYLIAVEFNIWYELDKGIYTDEPVFTKTLQFVRDNKLK